MTVRPVFAALALIALAATTGHAQDKMGAHKTMGGKGMMGKKTVAKPYSCPECKMSFSAADAKKMHMKDAMGHPLKKTAASKKMGSGKM
jgi:hypothetical protein